MWKKLTGGGDSKKLPTTGGTAAAAKEYKSVWEEINQEAYKTELKEIWKLNASELGEAIKKYETYCANQKKDFKKCEEDRDLYMKKFSSSVEERNRFADEREELQQQLQSIQQLLNQELTASMKTQQDLTLAQNQIISLKNKLKELQEESAAVTSPNQNNIEQHSQQQQQHNNNQVNLLQLDDDHHQTQQIGSKQIQHKRISLNPDSELMLFVSEEELQHLRDLYESTMNRIQSQNESIAAEQQAMQSAVQSHALVVRIEGIPQSADEDNLQDLFKGISASVESISIPLNENNQSKGFAIVEFVKDTEFSVVEEICRAQSLFNGAELKALLHQETEDSQKIKLQEVNLDSDEEVEEQHATHAKTGKNNKASTASSYVLQNGDVQMIEVLKDEWKQLNASLVTLKNKISDFLRNRHVIERTQNDEFGELQEEVRRLRGDLEQERQDKFRLLEMSEENAKDMLQITSEKSAQAKQFNAQLAEKEVKAKDSQIAFENELKQSKEQHACEIKQLKDLHAMIEAQMKSDQQIVLDRMVSEQERKIQSLIDEKNEKLAESSKTLDELRGRMQIEIDELNSKNEESLKTHRQECQDLKDQFEDALAELKSQLEEANEREKSAEESHENTISELKTQIGQLESSIALLTQKCNESERKEAEITSNNSTIDSQIQSQQQQELALNKLNEDHAIEIDTLKKQLDSLQLELNSSESAKQSLQSEMNNATNNLEQLKAEFQAVKKECETLKETIQEITGEKEKASRNAENEVSQLKNQLASSLNKLEVSVREHEEYVTKMNSIHARESEQEAKVKAEGERESLEKEQLEQQYQERTRMHAMEIAGLEETHRKLTKKLEEEIEVLSHRFEASSNTISSLNSEIDAANTRIRNLTGETLQYKEKLTAEEQRAKDGINLLQSRIDLIQKENESLKASNSSLSDSANAAKLQHSKELKVAEDSLSAFKSDLSKQLEEINALKQNLQRVAADKEKLEVGFNALTRKSESEKKDFDRIKKESEKQLEKSKNDSEKEIKKLREQLDEKSKQVDQLKAQKTTLTNDFTKIKEENSKMGAELNKLKEENARILGDVSKLNNDMLFLGREKANLIEEKVSLKASIDKLSGVLASNEERSSSTNSQISRLTSELADVNRVLKEREEEQFLAKKEFENKLIQEKLKHEQTKKDLSKLDEKFAISKKDLLALADASDKDKSLISALTEKRTADKKKLKEKQERITHLLADSIKLSNERDSAVKQAEEILEQAKKEREAHTTSNSGKSFQTIISEKTLENEILQSKLTQSDVRNEELTKQIEEYEKKVAEMATELEECHAAVVQLKQKRENALNEIKKLTIQIDVLKSSQTNPNRIAELTELLNKAVQNQSMNNSMSQQHHGSSASNSHHGPKGIDDILHNTQEALYERGGVSSGGNPSMHRSSRSGYSTGSSSSNNNNNNNNNSYNNAQSTRSSMSNSSSNNNYEFNHNDVQLVHARREKRALNMLKKDLESLYKEYVMLIMNLKYPKESIEARNFFAFEKNMNRINEKTQDLIDYIDEQQELEKKQLAGNITMK